MKRVLITGTNSYIGNYLNDYLKDYSNDYDIDFISLRDGSWKNNDIHFYDSVFHVAGLAHIKETNENKHLYYEINRDLAYEFANYCKESGIKHFIFLSSMSVYGIENGTINKGTALNPNNHYGKSKLEAEILLENLQSESFKLAILRPPMVYGKDTKGNYPRLSKLAIKTPAFPNIDNERSMIYIENLCEFVRLLIDDEGEGIFCPQNKEYVNTTHMVKLIADFHGKSLWLTKIFNPIIKLLNIGVINKVFGNLTYDKELSSYSKDYNVKDFKTSIELTEG
ncbi:MAG: NAD-dependent epimerase/dehydratase family protein [Tissierella sp.]|uniref:NAD-dependent epimerase/dehydratase family protein n=1 Tax=Tissierella sp. TaxID=41274 RepID=UPI003F97BBFB